MTPTGKPTYQDFVPDDEGREWLRAVVFHERHGDEELLVPSRVQRYVVQEFLEAVVEPKLGVESVGRAADVARFYVLGEAVHKFERLLIRRENEEHDVIRSIECLRLIGDIGDAEQQTTAASYFDYLLSHKLFDRVIEDLIECYFHLDASVTDKPIAEQLKRRLQLLKRDQKDPDQPGPEYHQTEEHLENTLPITKAAKQFKEKLLAEAGPLKRATGLARTYIGLDDPAGIEWPKWSAFAIMAEVTRSGDKNTVGGLRAALGAIPTGVPPEYLEFARSRATRAIAFLGGTLTDEETAWLAYGKARRFQLEG